MSPRCAPAAPWKMGDAYLPVRCARVDELIEKFGIDRCSTRLKWVSVQKFGAQELERAVDIAHTDAQDQAHEHLPAPGVELAHPGVLPIYTVPDDRVVFIDEVKKLEEVANIELTIRVHKKGQIFGRGGKAIHQRRAVSLIDRVRDHPHARVGLRDRLNDLPGTVAAAIIDNNHFKISDTSSECGENSGHCRCADLVVVIRGHNDREAMPGD